MKQVYYLNGHSTREVAWEVNSFLKKQGFNGMKTELLREDDCYHIIAIDSKRNLAAKAVGGDTRCEVFLNPVSNNMVEVRISKGSWAGKVVTAGAVVTTCALFPAGVPAIVGYAIGGVVSYTGAKAVHQMKLPSRIDDHISEYLNG